MPYRLLAEIGHGYKKEVGTPGERIGYLRMLETRLQATLTLADTFKAESAAGPRVATNLPAKGLQGQRVKALAKFHEQQQDNTTKLDRLNAEVIRMRQWLFRQGAQMTYGGKIMWPTVHRVVKYDTQLAEQQLTRVEFRGGNLHVKGQPLDTTMMTTAFSGPGYGIFVMSIEGHIHVSSHIVGNRHHSSLLGGGVTAAAGELKTNKQGKLLWLSNKSGHYQPDLGHLLEILHELQFSGVPMTFQIQEHPSRTTYANVDLFMKANHFDDDTYETDQTFFAFRQYLTPEFFKTYPMAFLKPGGGITRTGIYDMRFTPPIRITPQVFEKTMKEWGMSPQFTLKTGQGR